MDSEIVVVIRFKSPFTHVIIMVDTKNKTKKINEYYGQLDAANPATMRRIITILVYY